jgi:hypothetical protein
VLRLCLAAGAAAADRGLFGCFHKEHGSLLFSALGIGIYVLIYSRALHQQLHDQQS